MTLVKNDGNIREILWKMNQHRKVKVSPYIAPKWVREPVEEIKVCILGKSQVGKTTLVSYFIHNVILTEYEPTIEHNSRKHILIDGRKHNMDILDTSGLDDYSCLNDQQINSSNGFILMYDTSSVDSFEAISTYYEKILDTKDAFFVPIVLIAQSRSELLRQVSTMVGQELAESLGTPLFELNLRKCTFYDVERIFDDLANMMKKRRIVPNSEIEFVKNLQEKQK